MRLFLPVTRGSEAAVPPGCAHCHLSWAGCKAINWCLNSFSILGAWLPSGEGISLLLPVGRVPRGHSAQSGKGGSAPAPLGSGEPGPGPPSAVPVQGEGWAPPMGGDLSDSTEAPRSEGGSIPTVKGGQRLAPPPMPEPVATEMPPGVHLMARPRENGFEEGGLIAHVTLRGSRGAFGTDRAFKSSRATCVSGVCTPTPCPRHWGPLAFKLKTRPCHVTAHRLPTLKAGPSSAVCPALQDPWGPLGAAGTPGWPRTSELAADASACSEPETGAHTDVTPGAVPVPEISLSSLSVGPRTRSSFHGAFHVAAQVTAGSQQRGTGGVRAGRGFAFSPALRPRGVGSRKREPGPARQDRDGMHIDFRT